jgi:AraC family transcriptional regulator of arabinose operon
MGRIIGLSPSRLRHMFKAETGTTPTQFLKSLRIRKAKSLLETTRLSVKEVMASVGVSDPSNFTRDFKRAHGLTPTQVRNCHRIAVLPLLWSFECIARLTEYVPALLIF